MPPGLPSPQGTSSPEEVTALLSGAKSRKKPAGESPRESTPTGCEKCDGFGNIIDEQGARPCECKIRYLEEESVRRAGIPPLFARKDLSNFHHRAKGAAEDYRFARWYVEQYSRENNRGLLLIGPCGVGKTHLAIGILKELLHREYSGLYFNIIALLDAIKASYDRDLKATQGINLEIDLDADVLIIDDLGAEKMSAWVADRLYAIINQRYERNRTLILTTNLDYARLGDRVGQRIISRIYEMCILHPCKGEDYRYKHKKEVKKV
jgi:DNA replication protein DnaC